MARMSVVMSQPSHGAAHGRNSPLWEMIRDREGGDRGRQLT